MPQQTMLDRLRELSDDALVARERSDNLKAQAKDAKEYLDGVLAQLQLIAYKLSHGLQDLPFDGDPVPLPDGIPPAPPPPGDIAPDPDDLVPPTVETPAPPALPNLPPQSTPTPLTPGTPPTPPTPPQALVGALPQALTDAMPENADMDRVRMFRRLIDEHGVQVQFRELVRWSEDDAGQVRAWLDGGPERPAFLPAATVTPTAEPEAVPELDLAELVPEPVPMNRRRRKHHEPALAPDPDNDTPHTPMG